MTISADAFVSIPDTELKRLMPLSERRIPNSGYAAVKQVREFVGEGVYLARLTSNEEFDDYDLQEIYHVVQTSADQIVMRPLMDEGEHEQISMSEFCDRVRAVVTGAGLRIWSGERDYS